MHLLQGLVVFVLGMVLLALGLFMLKTGKSPIGVTPGQEEFQEMHATAFAVLYRGLGTGYAAMGAVIQLSLLSDLATIFR